MHKQSSRVDLRDMAYRVMLNNGFQPDLPAAAATELAAIKKSAEILGDPESDFRALLWSSIDNIDSEDLDQIEYAERVAGSDDIRLLIGIADVDSLVGKDSQLDHYAGSSCTSVYTGVRIFPMLPEALSTNLSSLRQDADRLAVVVDMIIEPSGEIKKHSICCAYVRNKAKLAYEYVADWLNGGQRLQMLDSVPGLEEQLRLQDELAQRLQGRNQRSGALSLQTIEARPVTVDGHVTALELTEHNRARDMVQSFMVAANSALAQTVHAAGMPMIQRIVRKPAKWPKLVSLAAEYGFKLPALPDAPALSQFVAERKVKDPVHFPDLSLSVVKLLGPGEYVVQIPGQDGEGHFGLAVHDYTHATAPNRRYADLVTQRLCKALANNEKPPYEVEQLQAIAQRCQEREEAARRVERTMRKASAAMLLSDHIGEQFAAIVTGITGDGTFARMLKPPAEGRIVTNEQGLDVGDKITVKLLSTDPSRGFIDFERV